jgi:cobalamin biosynthesis protein CbiG
MDLKSGHVPDQLAAQLAGDLDVEPIATTMGAVA